jgi:pimeloyl-ACP methyl ester carboxylesterase
MRHLLFIHGAWHWSGCWDKVIQSGILGGCKSHALDNVGHGVNKSLSANNFDEYIANLQDLLKQTEGKVTIIAHSMGGSIASYIANKFPQKIKKIIYVAAFMCAQHKSPLDYIMAEQYALFMRKKGLDNLIISDAKGQLIKLNLADHQGIIKLFYNQSNNIDIEFALKNLTEMNSGIPFSHKHNYCNEFSSIKRVYVECINDNAIPITTQRKMQEHFPGAKIYSLETDHSPFFSQEKELAVIIRKELFL